MHQRTMDTLRQLEDASWFLKVGVQDTENAIVLSSWNEALAHSTDKDWENILLRMANNFTMRLFERARERFAKWNDVVDEVKEVAVPLIERKIEGVVRENGLPKAFGDAVRWDIVHLCMESEYADVCPPGFYAGQAYWYIKGHFPCGWDSTLSKGRPIVY